jgi:hypothetical protein
VAVAQPSLWLPAFEIIIGSLILILQGGTTGMKIAGREKPRFSRLGKLALSLSTHR